MFFHRQAFAPLVLAAASSALRFLVGVCTAASGEGVWTGGGVVGEGHLRGAIALADAAAAMPQKSRTIIAARPSSFALRDADCRICASSCLICWASLASAAQFSTSARQERQPYLGNDVRKTDKARTR